MNLTNLKINDLITPEAKLTFLVGAGCSVDKPSCLPDGHTMMKAIINYTCANSEKEKIMELKELRFEQLIEIIRDHLDPELKVIDFYGLCDKPNIQHFFLAEMMKNGQFVLTTNFDFLIEYALKHSGIPKEEIKIVITKEDFGQAEDPQELFSNGIKTLYKIHGSTKNFITEESTRKSLIATIQAFGTNKEGENVFQLEPFKQLAFENLTIDRSLVVIGYSGSDDFDIVPTLNALKKIQHIIWINYLHNDGGKELIYEIEKEDIDNYENLPKVDQILADIKHINYTKHVFRVDINTSRMVRELISSRIKKLDDSDKFSVDAYEWLSNNIQTPNKFIKLYIPYKIYYDFNMYKDAMSILKTMLNKAELDEDQKWKAAALSNIGGIFRAQGKYQEALKHYEEALQISEQLDDMNGKATLISSIGVIYDGQGKFKEALEHYEEGLKIFKQLGDLVAMSSLLNSIGEILRIQGRYGEALKHCTEALQIDDQLGDLNGKAIHLNNIGGIYHAQGKFKKALQCYEEALQINEQLGNLVGKALGLGKIATIHHSQENYPEALKLYEEALQIDDQLGDLHGKATILSNIGAIHYTQKDLEKAGKYFNESLTISWQLGDKYQIFRGLCWAGKMLIDLNEISKALQILESALEISEQLGLEEETVEIRETITRLKST